jgi:hypothetical protein
MRVPRATLVALAALAVELTVLAMSLCSSAFLPNLGATRALRFALGMARAAALDIAALLALGARPRPSLPASPPRATLRATSIRPMGGPKSIRRPFGKTNISSTRPFP